MRSKFEKPESIEKIRIPDDEVNKWIETLHDLGFSAEEIDYVMEGLNQTWRKKKYDGFIQAEFEKLLMFHRKNGHDFSPEDKERFFKWLEKELTK